MDIYILRETGERGKIVTTCSKLKMRVKKLFMPSRVGFKEASEWIRLMPDVKRTVLARTRNWKQCFYLMLFHHGSLDHDAMFLLDARNRNPKVMVLADARNSEK
jgi:hypothetical protein